MLRNSIVMTTYNGERYLTEQLESLIAQELLPDEIVIADDCSTDGSFALARAFAETHPEVEWNVYRNEHNLGWKCNFKEAITKARGDLIYLCDQDDIWTPNHIADLRRAMEAHPEIDVMISHAEPFYEEGAFKSASSRHSNAETGEVFIVPADKNYLIVGAPGCTYCVRSAYAVALRPYWPDDFPHDSILYSTACLKGTLGFLDTTTLRFRRHSANASDERTKSRKDSLGLLRYYLRKDQVMRRYLMSLDEDEQVSFRERGVFGLLDATDEFSRARIAALEKPSPVSLARLISHSSMYPTRRSMLGDFACALFPNKEWRR